jgi:MFS transporter, DHA1 family, inner membrane transport protein
VNADADAAGCSLSVEPVTSATLVRERPRLRSRIPAPQLPIALLALALGGFAIGTTEFVAMGLLPQVAHGVDVSIPTAGHVISAYALGVVIGAPVLAGLGAKLPRRRLLVALMVAYAVGNVLSALATNYPTLMAARFLTGLPHGAYFGVASLVAADLAPAGMKARAVSRVLLGLSVANVIGVPFATWLGQTFGWRVAFAGAAALAALTAASVLKVLPHTPADGRATMRRELTALQRPQVLLAVATGAIGGGGMFAVYSYISPILTDRAGLGLGVVPLVLAIWGAGMVAGTLAAGRVMDRAPKKAMVFACLAMAAVFGTFAVTSASPVLAPITVFFLGMAVMLPTGLQMRLMNVAGDAQTLAAALNHSSFNIANALGAWLGGVVLAAGLGLTAPMLVAVGLSLGGLGILLTSFWLERYGTLHPAPS